MEICATALRKGKSEKWKKEQAAPKRWNAET